MGMTDCSRFLNCSAPICPLSKRSVNRNGWYPDEEICHKPQLRKMYKWIRIQSKIQNKSKSNFDAGMFTVEMLLRIRKVHRTVSGVYDIKHKSLLKTWLENHPPITDDERARIAKRAEAASERMKEYRLGKV